MKSWFNVSNVFFYCPIDCAYAFRIKGLSYEVSNNYYDISPHVRRCPRDKTLLTTIKICEECKDSIFCYKCRDIEKCEARYICVFSGFRMKLE